MIIHENHIIRLEYKESISKLIIYLKNAEIYSLSVLEGISEIVGPINDIVKTEIVDCIISVSEDLSTWGLGGDLEYFFHTIQENKQKELYDYAHKCVELVFLNNCGFHTRIPTVAIISGRAFGGGFESALSSNIILSRPRAKATFPEVKFGSFPGMGAYSILTRKLGFAKADEFIAAGKSYSAQELKELKLIDGIIDYENVEELSQILQPFLDEYNADTLKQLYHRIPKEELIAGTDMWVEQMLSLSNNDTKKIFRIFNLQKR